MDSGAGPPAAAQLPTSNIFSCTAFHSVSSRRACANAAASHESEATAEWLAPATTVTLAEHESKVAVTVGTAVGTEMPPPEDQEDMLTKKDVSSEEYEDKKEMKKDVESKKDYGPMDSAASDGKGTKQDLV